MSDRIFVTGANGRVGRTLVARLVAEGHTVTGLARSETKADIVRGLGAQCMVGDLTMAATIREGLEGARVVYHLSGGVRGPGRETPDRINREGAENIAAVLRDSSNVEAVVFTSTCAVYGDRNGLWVDEGMPPHPNTRYGQSKVDAEVALRTAGLPIRVVRLAAVYGRDFPFMMRDAIVAERAWLPGEGRNFVPTIHVDDAVSGLIRVAEQGCDGAIYNLADTEPVTLRAFYEAVHAHVGGKPVRFWSTWVPSYVQAWAARNNERAQSRLNSTPRFTPDNLRLFTASVRLRVDRIREELGMTWDHPKSIDGVQSVLNSGPS